MVCPYGRTSYGSAMISSPKKVRNTIFAVPSPTVIFCNSFILLPSCPGVFTIKITGEVISDGTKTNIEVADTPEVYGEKQNIARAFIINELNNGDTTISVIHSKLAKTHPQIYRKVLSREVDKLIESGLIERKGFMLNLSTKEELVQ